MRGKSKLLLISFLLGFAYSMYLICYFTGIIGSGDGVDQAGAVVATAIVMPHMILTALATIFNGLGCFLNKRGFALTGAILYAVAMVLMPIYFMFVVLQMILSFVGFACMKKGD